MPRRKVDFVTWLTNLRVGPSPAYSAQLKVVERAAEKAGLGVNEFILRSWEHPEVIKLRRTP